MNINVHTTFKWSGTYLILCNSPLLDGYCPTLSWQTGIMFLYIKQGHFIPSSPQLSLQVGKIWNQKVYFLFCFSTKAIYIRQGSSPETEVTNLYVEFDFYASNPQIHGTYDKEHCHLGSTMYCYHVILICPYPLYTISLCNPNLSLPTIHYISLSS